MKSSLPKIKKTVSSRGVLIIAQSYKRGTRFFYSNKENVLNCPHAQIVAADEMEIMYKTGRTDFMFVGWYWNKIRDSYTEVDGSVITKKLNRLVVPSDVGRLGLRCAQVYIPILELT